MFNFFKSKPEEKLQKEYDRLLAEAVAAQRNGDIAKYSELHFDADKILKEIDKLLEQ
jgi:hypothetical protein